MRMTLPIVVTVLAISTGACGPRQPDPGDQPLPPQVETGGAERPAVENPDTVGSEERR